MDGWIDSWMDERVKCYPRFNNLPKITKYTTNYMNDNSRSIMLYWLSTPHSSLEVNKS